MTSPKQDQYFESFLPVYDTIPENWEEGRQFLVEQLKKINNAINVREIGWYLDEELLTGGQFIPSATATDQQQYRSVFRQVYTFPAVVIGANTIAHGITIDASFTLVRLFVSATDDVTNTAGTFVYSEVTLDATNINFNSPLAYTKAYAVLEYLLEP